MLAELKKDNFIVITTRSKEANYRLINNLKNPKLTILPISLIKYEILDFDFSIIQKFSNLIITSNFVALNIPDNKFNSNIDIFVVGDKSAKILIEKSYNIKYCANNVKELIKNIPIKLYDFSLYLSGNIITTPMPSRIKRVILYNVSYLQTLNYFQIMLLKKTINYILIYSENCAKNFLSLLIKNNLVDKLKNTKILTMSYKAANILQNYSNSISLFANAELIEQYLERL